MKACYVHVPFCKHICSYCDFMRCGYHQGLADKWLQTITNEITMKLSGAKLSTIYIGGGTPSALMKSQLTCLLKTLSPYQRKVTEYTMEANVDSFDDAKIQLCVTYGVNRISLGVQTLQEDLLKDINRHHSYQDVKDTIHAIHKHGIHNISIDLMYGLPNQSMEMWQADLKRVIAEFDIQHISLYALTIEEHSEYGRKQVQNIDSQLEADMYEYAIAYLTQHGFEHYEISNFARKGYASKHNLAYWRYEDFYGIGVGASGKKKHCRYDNTKNLQTYLEKGASPTNILLTEEDEMFEMLMMSLRTKDGISFLRFKETFGIDIREKYQIPLQKQFQNGCLLMDETHIWTSYKGMLLLNDVLIDFLP